MFSQACVKNSVQGGGGACVVEGHAWLGGAYVVGVCKAGGVRGRKDGHGSRRYASYWNAFLFGQTLDRWHIGIYY